MEQDTLRDRLGFVRAAGQCSVSDAVQNQAVFLVFRTPGRTMLRLYGNDNLVNPTWWSIDDYAETLRSEVDFVEVRL